jgi:hypothetical protein
MADAQPASPGFFGWLGGLFGGGQPQPQPDYAGPKPTGTIDDYLTARQAARFQQMTNEVQGMLKANPVNPADPSPTSDWAALRRGLRQKGYDQKEEDAIMNKFVELQGGRQGWMSGAMATGRGEDEPLYGSNYKNIPDPEAQAIDPSARSPEESAADRLFGQRIWGMTEAPPPLSARDKAKVRAAIKKGQLPGGPDI